MKPKKQAPVYLVKNNYAAAVDGRHPQECVMVEEMDVPLTVDGARTYREVMTKEVHHSTGENIHATKAAALQHASE